MRGVGLTVVGNEFVSHYQDMLNLKVHVLPFTYTAPGPMGYLGPILGVTYVL